MPSSRMLDPSSIHCSPHVGAPWRPWPCLLGLHEHQNPSTSTRSPRSRFGTCQCGDQTFWFSCRNARTVRSLTCGRASSRASHPCPAGTADSWHPGERFRLAGFAPWSACSRALQSKREKAKRKKDLAVLVSCPSPPGLLAPFRRPSSRLSPAILICAATTAQSPTVAQQINNRRFLVVLSWGNRH